MTLLLTQLIRPRLVDRGLVYLAAFSPFLVGITIYWFIQSKHLRFKNAVLGIVALTLVLMSLAQYYPCQPLIPKISTNLGSYYVMDTRAANSIYKRSMIYFINTYDTKLTMATDPMTIDLIYCLSEPPIYALITSEDPLQKSITAQLSLVSFDENSSPIVSGREAIEYIQNVQNATKNNSVIYTNGKSCILLNRK
jgi:hypothetical protein